MPYLVVLALSLLVGGAVYLATVRREGEVSTLGFGDDVAPSEVAGAPSAGPGYSYLRVSTQGPSNRDRIQGLVGLMVLVGIGAAVLAFALYQGGRIINVVIESFLGS